MQNNRRLRNLIALSLIPGLGSKRVKQLLRVIDEPEDIFRLSKAELRSAEGIGEASALSILAFDDWEKVEEIISQTQKIKAEIISLADSEYPPLLKQIYDPPILLWLKGDTQALSKPGVGVIGTRNSTNYGRKQAEKFSKELGEQGLCIFSGLAYGIDAIAHQAALDAGTPTVAVLGSGIDNLYPAKHTDLANNIVRSGGAVISEFSLGTNPDAGNFPLRNRVVSGLSLGVLVVESGVQGGSMITADLALDQNREVFAVPHSLENLSGSGCNYLIKTGAAKLVQTINDILDELPVQTGSTTDAANTEFPAAKTWRDHELDEISTQICELLEQQVWQIDDLSDQLKINTSQLLVALLQLEMKELVNQKAGKIFELR